MVALTVLTALLAVIAGRAAAQDALPAPRWRVVADVVLRAASAARPRLRYTAGGLANRLRWLRRFAPAAVMDAGVRKDLRLDTPAAPLQP